MNWYLDSTRQPLGAPHVEGCGYQFHGTYSGLAKGDFVDYDDSFTFTHDLAGGGTAVVSIEGYLHFVGSA